MATLQDMEEAACCILRIIKDTPDLVRSTKVAIAGDMAVRKYLPQHRQNIAGQSIDLIINSSTSASLLRKKLLQHPMSPLVEVSQILYYHQQQTPPVGSRQQTTPGIEVRITSVMLYPYLPAAARSASEIPTPTTAQHLPYVSLIDLIVFKMDACGLRDSAQSKQHEARDAAALLELATKHSALQLNPSQTRAVEESLADILRHSDPDKQGKGWWQTRLRGTCDPDARKSPDEILTNLIEEMNLDGNGGSNNNNNNNNSNNKTSTTSSSNHNNHNNSSSSSEKSPVPENEGNWWAKGLVSRTSSSSSKVSMASTASSTGTAATSFTSISGNFSTPCASPIKTQGPGFSPHSHSRTSSKDFCVPTSRSGLGPGAGAGAGSDAAAAAAAATATAAAAASAGIGASGTDTSMPITGRRPRKFSTSQQSPTKSGHIRNKKSIDQRPRRHSQLLGTLPVGHVANHASHLIIEDGSLSSPGLALTARFESTPGDDQLITGSYF